MGFEPLGHWDAHVDPLGPGGNGSEALGGTGFEPLSLGVQVGNFKTLGCESEAFRGTGHEPLEPWG